MPKPLFLESLEILRFRAFDQLSIERLGRVNLIVGKNNVGKSCLLEALLLYVYQGAPSIVWKILEARDEGSAPRPGTRRRPEEIIPALRYLFHGRKDLAPQSQPILVGPIGSQPMTLSVNLAWRLDDGHQLPLLPAEDEVVGFLVRVGDKEVIYRLDSAGVRYQDPENVRCAFVPANGIGLREIGRLWDSISLTDLEDDVIASLRVISPAIERVSVVSRSQVREWERSPIVKIDGVDEPLPLRSMGEGMNRLFGLSLALVNAKNGVFLVDEIESGLHYSVQPMVWQLVFEAARRLNIQVFATTHSWDCLTAFQEAAKKYEQDEGVLVRLTQKEGRIIADLFDEEDLVVVAREGIEVR